jgi:threonine/homoserine/homoserine lactone efflux protein
VLAYLVLGSGLAFAAVIQPGPLQAFLLSRATAEGWRGTLPAALSPLLSDGPIALLVLLVLGRLPEAGQQVLRAAGGLLLLALAWSTARSLRADRASPAPPRDAVPRTLLQAAAVNLLNPNPWLAWTLVLGPTVVSAWQQAPALAVAFVAAFYGVMVTGLGLFILVASTARFLSPRAQRALVGLSAAVLAALGAWQLFAGLRAIVPV